MRRFTISISDLKPVHKFGAGINLAIKTIARSDFGRPKFIDQSLICLEAASEQVHARGLRPMAVLVRRSTLEDVFLRLTGRTLVD